MASFPRSQRFEHDRIVRICSCRDVNIIQTPAFAVIEHPLQPFTIAWLPSVVTARCGVKAEILHRSASSTNLTPVKRRITTAIMSNNKDMQPGDTAAWNWGGSSIEGRYPWMPCGRALTNRQVYWKAIKSRCNDLSYIFLPILG